MDLNDEVPAVRYFIRSLITDSPLNTGGASGSARESGTNISEHLMLRIRVIAGGNILKQFCSTGYQGTFSRIRIPGEAPEQRAPRDSDGKRHFPEKERSHVKKRNQTGIYR